MVRGAFCSHFIFGILGLACRGDAGDATCDGCVGSTSSALLQRHLVTGDAKGALHEAEENMENCESWCNPDKNSCTWDSCKGCADCESIPKCWRQCKNKPEDWSVKCTWWKCEGCEDCAVLPPSGYAYVGKGYCNADAGYIGGWDAADAVDLDTCAQKCNSEPNCKFFSLLPGQSCSRYSSDAGDCSSRHPPEDYATYEREKMPLSGYAYVGKGYCNEGYIGGWDAADAVDRDTCAQKCNSEPNCKFFSLLPGQSCSRYSSDAGDCSSRYPREDYATYERTSYVPGEPGAEWTPEHQKVIRAKLIRVFQEPDTVCSEGQVQVPGERWSGLPTMAKFLRLAFHDCMKYADGTGGCDGCLEWTGVGERFARDELGKFQLNVSDDGHNNGLQPTVEILEKIYTDPTFPQKAPSLPQSPKDSGLSRADLWAFAGMVAVEHGIQLNNLACNKLDLNDNSGILNQCHPRVGEPDCEVAAPRAFNFASGRKDCIPDPTVDKPYKTFKKELHPDPGANASSTLEYFKRDFGFNARETVAILGAHTLGRVHNTISLHQYTWKTRSAMLFNNGYYRNLASKEDWYYPTGKFPNGTHIRSTCRGFGNSSGQRPPARWRPHAFASLKNGGPVQWLQEKKVCPCFDPSWTHPPQGCCNDDPFSCSADCEQYRFVLGMDETMLNSDMSLYRDFSTTDGIPGGCPGLQDYNSETIKSDWRLRSPRIPSGDATGKYWDSSSCAFTTISDPPGSTPMYQVVEEYAESNEKFFSDFFPVLEKMLMNGYNPSHLLVAPMAIHTCPYQDPYKWDRSYSCS